MVDQQRLQILERHFDKFPTFNVFMLEDHIQNLGTCLFKFIPSEALLWIKEVEMVDSVDDLKPSCSIQ